MYDELRGIARAAHHTLGPALERLIDRMETLDRHVADQAAILDRHEDALASHHTRIHKCWARIENGGKF